MKILVATDDLTFSVSLSRAYKDAGHSVSAGVAELFLGLRAFDLIHFHWPEELTQWQVPPLAPLVDRLFARLDALAPAPHMVCTVHNLLPHADPGPVSRAFYARFYKRMDRIGHFSQSSLDAVQAAFPEIPADKHFIHGMNDFSNLRAHATGRETARQHLNIAEPARVIAAIGQIRSLDELALLSSAIDKCDVANIHVVRAFRPPSVATLRSRVRRKLLMRAFERKPNTAFDGYLEDADLVRVCEAADLIVIPRMENQLNSGVLPLAMTFGTGVVAPQSGVFREMLSGSMNALYAPGNSEDLAKAIARLATDDPSAVRASNRTLAANWGWSHAIKNILATVSK